MDDNLDDSPKVKRPDAAKTLTADDCWPVMIEFLLSQKAWWVAVCAEFDLSPMQGHAVRVLEPDRPLAMSTLAEALVCDASNVTGIVDKLESRGLIARQGAEGDRRIKMLVVTEKGRSLRDRLWARTMEAPRAVTALPEETRRRLAEALRAVVDERFAESADPT
ncbi:MAG TPA: MarR family transcriptional regulator [Polyangia bacterium]|jgi:DNA-binding MarR family transcriptional regulator